MGSRALRALRGELVLPGIRSTLDDDDDENEEAEQRRRHPAFAIMNDDDEDDVSSSSSDKGDEDDLGAGKDSNEEVKTKQEVASLGADDKQQELVDEEEDLDALLIEFQEKDNLEPLASGQADAVRHDASPFDLILASFDARDLDYEYSMRTSMLNTGREPSSSTYNQQRQRKYPLFGPPRDGWVRPPRLIGGGIGMTTHDVDASRPLPWPYCNGNNTGGKASWQWCTFVHSDTYERIIQEYRTVIQQSGDLDALVMFVAHHPYVTAALMQMTTVLYQTNHSQDGLALLRRCLWVFESSALATFVNEISDGKVFLMDRDQPENAVFFQALFRLVQVSHIAGLSRTALAASRLVLSMDPLRDPMSILLALDTHAIATSRGGGSVDQKMILCWMIDMVESDLIRIWHRNTETDQKCDLLNLPNWAYSYALALFLMRSVEENGDLTDIKRRSDEAIQLALSRFPSVVGLLLQSLEVDTTGRSFKRDWITVLDFATARWRQLVRDWHAVSKDNVVLAATLQTCDLVIQIFVQQNAKQWGDDDILQWIYDNMKVLQSQVFDPPPPPSPAIMRYACADPADYDNKLQMLPPDANIINPGLLAHAMVVNPNRPRFLRPMQQRGDGDGGDLVLDANGNRVPQRHLLGPPIHHVDPDWPMVEVFWRSFLPWNHVEGIPPPRR